MEKTNLYYIDEFGVKNYNYWVLGLLSFIIFMLLNLSLGYLVYWAESEGGNTLINDYGDAIWLMVMSSTTIGFGDVYPITLIGRISVFMMFVLGVGVLGGAGAIFANKIFGFADTNIKNRELRKQNEEIFQQNVDIYKKLAEVDQKLESLLDKKSST
jgi:hypothetical protein